MFKCRHRNHSGTFVHGEKPILFSQRSKSLTTIKMAPSVSSNIQMYIALLAETHICKQEHLPLMINSWCANIVEACFLNILAFKHRFVANGEVDTAIPTTTKFHYTQFNNDIRKLNPGRGEILHTCLNWPWSPPSLLYSEYQTSFPEVKWLGNGIDHPPLFSAEVKRNSAIPLLPIWALMVCSRVNILLFNNIKKNNI
jgi:hypothetical protein